MHDGSRANHVGLRAGRLAGYQARYATIFAGKALDKGLVGGAPAAKRPTTRLAPRPRSQAEQSGSSSNLFIALELEAALQVARAQAAQYLMAGMPRSHLEGSLISMFREADKNGDGTLSTREFLDCVKR